MGSLLETLFDKADRVCGQTAALQRLLIGLLRGRLVALLFLH